MLDINFDKEWVYFFHPEDGLIQGAPSSPLLFQKYCEEMFDEKIEEYCEENNLTYSRYFDDMLFSSKNKWITRKVRKGIYKIIYEAGFRLRTQKTIVADNKYKPITFLGMVLHNGWVDTTDELKEKIGWSFPDTPQSEGLVAWHESVIALNR